MIDWLMTGLWTTTLSIAMILLLRHPVANWLGAGAAYSLWLVLPLQLLASLPTVVAVAPVGFELPALTVTTATGAAEFSINGASPLPWLMGLWLAGSGLMMVLLVGRIVAARNLVADSRPLERSDRLLTEIRSFPAERIRVSGSTGAPLVAGLIRTFILVPPKINELLPDSSLRLVIAHEIHHAKRHDNLINLVASLMLAMFWFNPLIWVAFQAFRTDQELSCDAAVIAGLRPAERARYGHALLNLSGSCNPTALVVPWSHFHSIRRRILMLNKHRQSAFHRAAGALFVALATGLAVAVSAGTATGHPETAPADTAPKPLVRAQPAYPRQAVEQNIDEGHVRVEFTITEEGATEDIIFLEAQPKGMFEQSVIEAVSNWRFLPATEAGVPVPVRVVQTLQYKSDPENSVWVPEYSRH